MKLDLKSKLLLLSVATISFILVLSFMLLSKAHDDKENLKETKNRIIEADALSKVIHFLQIERGLTVGLIASENKNEKDDMLLLAMNNSDEAIDDATRAFSHIKNSDNTIVNLLNDVKSNRKGIHLLKLSATEAKKYYTKKISTLLNLTRMIPSMMNDKENRNLIQAYTNLSSAKESLGQIRANLYEVFSSSTFLDDTFVSFIGQLEIYNTNSIIFRTIVPNDIAVFFNTKINQEVSQETFKIIEEVKQSKTTDIKPSEWFDKSTQTINLLKEVEDKLFIRVTSMIDNKAKVLFYKIIILSLFLAISIGILIILMLLGMREVLFSNKKLIEKNSDSLLLLEQYKSAVDESFIVTKTDKSGVITYANDAFCKISGYTENELIGKSHNIIRHPDTPKETFKELWHTIKNLKKAWSGEVQNISKNRGSYWVKAFIKPILDRNGNVIEYIGIRTDITEIKEALTRYFLTGYGNRTKLQDDIKQLNNLSLAIFNLDNFRQINDFYGHEFGNNVIKAVADKIYLSIVHERAVKFYRLQGDEFVILASGYSKYIFEELVQKILKTVQESIEIDEEEIVPSCSCGISFEDESGKLLSTANMALKLAKRSNNNYLVYDDEISLSKEYESNITWSKKLSLAFEQNKIVTYYQPIVNNVDLKYEKYECLVRMIDGNKIISPFFFLDVAKQTRQYFDITKTVLFQAFEMFKEHDAEFSVNLSIIDMVEEQMLEYILAMLQKYNIGSRVVFEIVESEYIENFVGVINFINEVRKYGCKIAIDDFGTGYSNFEYLIRLKADYLKIDGSLIRNIDKDKNAYLVVSTIVDFAKKLKMKTIAEFVENEEIFKIVKELDIDYSQGYYFNAPKKNLF